MARNLAAVFTQERDASQAITIELANLAYALLRDLEKIEARNKELVAEMAVLKKQGLIYATTYWRPDAAGDNKYLYLHFPQRQGRNRDRRYIGADADKIAEALAGIERAKQYDVLATEHASIKKRINDAHMHVDHASCSLADKPRMFRAW